MKKMLTIMAIVLFLSSCSTLFCQKLKNESKLLPFEDHQIQLPAEVVVPIVMGTLPSGDELNDLDVTKAAHELLQALKKIMNSLGVGHFTEEAEKSLVPTLVQKIKEKKYAPAILKKALEDAANKQAFPLVLVLAKANGLPYKLMYDSLRLRNDDWKDFLILVERLKEKTGYMVDFNAMPYHEPYSRYHNTFNNPLNYLFDLYAKNTHIRANRTYYQKAIEYLLQWAHRNGYLHNIIAIDDEIGLHDFIQNIIANDMQKPILDQIKGYDIQVYRKLHDELKRHRGYSF